MSAINSLPKRSSLRVPTPLTLSISLALSGICSAISISVASLNTTYARLQGDDARNGELQFNLATQDRSRRFGQLKRRMLGNILRGKAEVDQLADNTHPVLMALVFPDAVNRQLVVTHIADTLVVSPAQHFNDVAHPKALVHASDSRERFARVHQAIVLLRRVEADIAVAARRLTPFTKVVE